MAELPSPELTQSLDLQPAGAPGSSQPPAPSNSVDSPFSKTWGNFQLLQRLGRGAFGEVFRAWDPALEREVALKLLLPRGLDPEQEVATLVAEARSMARVRHPNIVSVYGVDRREGRVGFWSDYIRGQTLSAFVAARGPVSETEAARLGVSLCEALAAVHNAGLLHRDIKPGNTMRDENGRVLLMDFGLSQGLLSSAGLAGTPGYLAPELRAGNPASVQSDIYAMGVLLRFVVTGSSAALPGQANAARTQARSALQEIISRATESEPQNRYVSAEQMAAALARAVAPPAAESKSLTPAQWRSGRWLVLAAVVLGFIFVPRLFHKSDGGSPAAGTPAFQNYLAANEALLRYDKPGNTDKAIDLYKQSPNYALAEAGLARAYWRKFLDTSETKWADNANQAAARAVGMSPNLAAVQMTQGTIHVDQGKFDVGLQELEQASKLDPRSADVHAALAEAYRQQGRLADAKAEFQTATDLDPDNWRWPYLLGALQIDSGDLKSAEQNLNEALAKTPDNARILYDLGIVYRKQDRLADAQRVLEKSVGLDARANPVTELANVLFEKGEFAGAIDMFKRAVELNPSKYDAWGNMAVSYLASGHYPELATESFKKAIALALAQAENTPEDPYLASVLGIYYANLHDRDHALPWMRKATALAPRDPDVIERVGEAYEILGDRRNALTYIAEALKLGYSVRYAKSDPALNALRRDPGAPSEIRESTSPH
jgi:serine/threonine-protein kinase